LKDAASTGSAAAEKGAIERACRLARLLL